MAGVADQSPVTDVEDVASRDLAVATTLEDPVRGRVALGGAALEDLGRASRVERHGAGLTLDDYQQTILLESAPHALAMARRMRRPRERHEEPALVFRFPA